MNVCSNGKEKGRLKGLTDHALNGPAFLAQKVIVTSGMNDEPPNPLFYLQQAYILVMLSLWKETCITQLQAATSNQKDDH